MLQNCVCRVDSGTELNGLNHISQIKKIVEKSLGHLFITSNSSHFFNKTDFMQYLFNENAIVTVR